MTKTNVLFVVGAFHRAGAERFAYEIDLALNKEKFKICILCLQNENYESTKWNDRYYEAKHKSLKTSISYIDEFLENYKKSKIERVFHKLTRGKFKKPKKGKYKTTLSPYLESFDVIHWMGEYTFIHDVTSKVREKSLIHSMCAKFQEPGLYDNYDFNVKYNFISGFQDDEVKFEYSQFKDIRHTYFPLALKIDKNKNSWKHLEKGIKKIGIFTRLDKNKPLDPFFLRFSFIIR